MATKGTKETVKLNVRVSARLAERLKIECVRRGLRIQEAAAQAVALWLKGGRS